MCAPFRAGIPPSPIPGPEGRLCWGFDSRTTSWHDPDAMEQVQITPSGTKMLLSRKFMRHFAELVLKRLPGDAQTATEAVMPTICWVLTGESFERQLTEAERTRMECFARAPNHKREIQIQMECFAPVLARLADAIAGTTEAVKNGWLARAVAGRLLRDVAYQLPFWPERRGQFPQKTRLRR